MMKRSLLSFIWAFSKRDQLFLVAVTALLFPLLYLTLELPKRIVNDAISAPTPLTEFMGYPIAQKDLLIVLCLAFLVAVLAHGVLKMRVNTMKGILAERLLRRFRYTLIEHILRFPRAYQSKTSEGELVSMVTAETEPMGGIMGDAIALPLLQAGQMITILLFLFLQSVWFGLAACMMVPLQAWLIPKMQRRVNVLNRSRIRQVRALASDIGEITTGAATLRQNMGWRYRMARTSARLGMLFETRFEIYRRKFFMKFVNNLLNQVPPFAFFLAGGLLVIDGQLTVGALVAAIAAYKDLSAPWKELLNYYTRVVEMGQRYDLVVERFAPAGLLPDFFKDPAAPVLPDAADQDILRLDTVSLMDADGHVVLNSASLDVPKGSWTRLEIEHDNDRATFVQMLLGELTPSQGQITLCGERLAGQDQAMLASRIGWVNAQPYIFAGTLRENIMMPLRTQPHGALSQSLQQEARRTGNSTDDAQGDWQTVDAQDGTESDWMRLIADMGAQHVLLARTLDQRLPQTQIESLGARLSDLRPRIAQVMPAALALPIFSPQAYSDALTLPENLLFAISKSGTWLDENLTDDIVAILQDHALYDLTLAQSAGLAATLIEAFDQNAGDTPLFRQLGIPKTILPELHAIAARHGGRISPGSLFSPADARTLVSLALNVPSARFDRAFKDTVKTAIVAARPKIASLTRARLSAHFEPLKPGTWNSRLSLLDNLLFGPSSALTRVHLDEVKTAATHLLEETLELSSIADLVLSLPTSLRGTNLSPHITEVVSLAQMIVKRPALIVLDTALASYAPEVRLGVFKALRRHFPDAAVLQLERNRSDLGEETGLAEQHLSLQQAQIVRDGADQAQAEQVGETSELRRKLQAIRKAPLFSELSGQQLRMLAFSARWIDVPDGSYVFRQDDAPDGAYIVYEGRVSLIARNTDGTEDFTVHPQTGTLVGELALIRNDPRRLDMRADENVTLLRIDPEHFLSILESDAQTAFKLIRVLIGYLDRPK